MAVKFDVKGEKEPLVGVDVCNNIQNFYSLFLVNKTLKNNYCRKMCLFFINYTNITIYTLTGE